MGKIVKTTGRNTFGTCFGEMGLKIRPDVFCHDNCEQKKHVLLCKMSPASHFFLFEKGEKNYMKSVNSCREETLWQTFCPTSCSRCISRTWTVVNIRFAISCDCMRSHAISCDPMRSHAIACNRMKLQTLCRQLSEFFFDAHRCAPSPPTAIHIHSDGGGDTNLAAAMAAWQQRQQLGGSEGGSAAALAALARPRWRR